VKKLKELPPHCRAGDNANAFLGGFRRWEEKTPNSKRDSGKAKSQAVDSDFGFPEKVRRT
jgi:polyphosphate glucokinase